MRHRTLAALGAVTLGLSTCLALPATAAPPPSHGLEALVDDGTYVVILRGDPVAIQFAPSPGHRFRVTSEAAQTYRQELITEQLDVLDEVGIPESLYTYTTAINGFAAALTSAQVKALMARPDVVSVQPSRTAHLDLAGRSVGPPLAAEANHLGLGWDTNAWRAVGGADQAGRGVVIGIIDSGIWPENPSFAALPLDAAGIRATYPGFTGSCGSGDRWADTACTGKIIAAQYFVDGFGADRVSSAEYLSPRDASGHGSHVAATAAGNAGVDVTIDGQAFGHTSGVAPAAALSIYKACWSAPDPSEDGCTTADAVAAVDRAVSDGVDVLNYSASLTGAGVDDAVELALLGAASAGVFVATSAGDGGPRAGSVAHASPWVTTVAASTHLLFQGAVRLGDGKTIVGSMVSDHQVGPRDLIFAGDAPAQDSTPHDAALCEPGSLDAQLVDRAIVVCRRGLVARVTKSAAVDQAGGAAMVLVNDLPGDTDTDVHAVPTVHVTQQQGRTILAYIASTPNPRASLEPTATDSTAVPQIADFSARGPATATGADILKPDVAAPGVSVVGAVAPESDGGRLWDLYSGTSMAAPQVAGLAALIASHRPHWSPAAVKSAIMSTAGTLTDSSTPLAHGSGVIRPHRALDPGLVYNADNSAWQDYLDGTVDASDLNLASISIGALVGSQVVTRRVTNVSHRTETYTATSAGLRGLAVRVAPSTLTLAPGESATFDVTVTAQRAARYGHFVTGTLTWRGSAGHVAVSPIVVRPDSIAAPADVRAEGTTGSLTIRGTAGVTGVVRASIAGLVPAQPVLLDLSPGVFDSRHPEASGAAVRQYTVADGVDVARFEVESPTSDIDLYVYRDGRLVAAATSTAGTEVVTLEHPAAGRYDVYVTAPAAAGSDAADIGPDVPATFTGWVVPARAGAHVDIDRRTPVTGTEPFGLDVSWSGLADSQRWFAEVRYRDSSRVTHLTIN
jgi:hypothetical protein